MSDRAPRQGLATGRMYLGKSRPRGSAEWRPQRRTRALLAEVQAVLAAYAFAITVRQIFYRLVGLGHVDKTEAVYESLGDMLNRARRAGIVGWDEIADASLSRYGPTIHDGAAGFMAWAARRARRHLFGDWAAGQEVLPLLWVESEGMAVSLRSAIAAAGWPFEVLTTSGTDSTRPKHDIAAEIIDHFYATGQRTVIGHIGDYDEAGLAICDALAEDLAAYATEAGCPQAVEVVWLALTDAQVAEYNLPTVPGKAGKGLWTPPGGTMAQSVQAEALDPNDLTAIAVDWATGLLDLDLYEPTMEALDAEQQRAVGSLERAAKRLR